MPSPVPDVPSRAPRDRAVPPLVKLLAAVGLGWLAWQGVLAGVRLWVDAKIAAPVGGGAIDFDLETAAGGRLSASALRGRWVVLNFFRSQCPGCNVEAPVIRELAARVDPERVAVVGVFVDRVQGYPAETSAATLARFGYAHPVVWADATFVDTFHGEGWAHVTPVTYVLAPDGTVARALRGHQSLATLTAALPEGAVGGAGPAEPGARQR